jgi:hypothetical protein
MLFEVGECVLNGSGAPFDAFVWMETTTERKLFFVEQMKFSRFPSSVNCVNINLIQKEFDKVHSSVRDHLKGGDFLFIMLCRRDGNFVAKKLPRNSVVVCNAQLRLFYGDTYYQRLKKRLIACILINIESSGS